MERNNATELSLPSAFATTLARCAGNDHQDNYDWRRFGPAPTLTRTSWQKLAGTLLKRLRRAGFVRAFVMSRLPGYRLYVRHFTTHADKTVLFATRDGG